MSTWIRCVAGILGFWIFVGLGGVAAQPASVSGLVTDASTGEALPGANVVVTSMEDEAVTKGAAAGVNGRYEIAGLTPGRYTVRVRFVGYSEAQREVALSAGEDRTLDIALQQEDIGLNPVVVTASRRQEKALDAPASVSVLGVEELERDPVPSAALTLRNTPGVDIARAGLDRYQISLRGFNAAFVSKTYVLVDYRQTVSPSLGVNAFNSMPISPIDLAQVEVVRGPGSALYGPGVEQGVIHFLTKDPLTNPGTSVMVAGGQQQLVQGSLRHAGVIGERLGYKIVGYYSTGEDWKMDPDDDADADVLNAIAPARLDKEGNVISPLTGRDYESESGYVAGTLEYQFSPEVTLTATGGWSTVTNTNIANTGENRLEGFSIGYGQVRLQAGGLFVQGYANLNDAGDTFFYRSGLPVVDESVQLSGQAQYDFAFSGERQRFTLGADAERTIPRTGGTIHGRFEGRDEITELGAYLQSETDLTDQLSLVVTGRVDWDDVIENTQFSPRAGLVYKLTPNHTVRTTYNRAFSTPAGVNFFLDLFIEDQGAFTVRGRGAVDGWTFADQLRTSSFIPGVGRYEGVGMPLQVAYAAAVSGLTGSDGPFPEALREVFLSKQIPGFSEGALVDTEGNPVEGVRNLDPIQQTVTNSFEVGYKGVIGERLLVNVDGYYTRKKNFLSELRPITPLVAVPGLPGQLVGAVSGAFSDAELAQLGLSRAQLEGAFQAAAENIAANPVGLVEPEENVAAREAIGQTRPELMLTYVNFGNIDFFGTDISVQYQVTDPLSVFANYSGVSDNFFDPEEVGEEGTGLVTSMNASQHKVRFGFNYREQGGWAFNASARWHDGYKVRSGVHNGTVDSYFIVDVGAGYDLSEYVPGTAKLDVMAQNVLDNRHREYVDVPEVGRLITTRLTYTF